MSNLPFLHIRYIEVKKKRDMADDEGAVAPLPSSAPSMDVDGSEVQEEVNFARMFFET